MKKTFIPVALLLLLLAACSPAIEATEVPKATLTPTPPPTQTATATITSTITATTTATSTDIPLILDDFNPHMSGIGHHGNMTCINYDGDLADIDDLRLKATFSQNGNVLDKSVPLEIIADVKEYNGNLCFENIDAKYTPGSPVEMVINVSGGNIEITNPEQTYELPDYEVVPMFYWIFGDCGLDKDVGGGFADVGQDFHRQWDLACSTNEFPNSVGTNIYAPANGIVMNYIDNVPGRNGLLTNLQVYLPDLGLMYNIGHIDDVNRLNVGDTFKVGEIVAEIDENQTGSRRPHTHFGVNTTEVPPESGPWGAATQDNWVDPFSHTPFGGDEYLSTGLWLPETVPQEAIDLISEGFFELHKTSPDYVPLPSYNK